MSQPAPATLYRIAAFAGVGSAIVLLINAAKRAEIIPTSAFTQLAAPFAQILALALVTGLYFAFGRRGGTFGAGCIPDQRVRTRGAGRRGVRDQPRLRRTPGRHPRRPARGPTGRGADRGLRTVPPRHPHLRRHHVPHRSGPSGAAGHVRLRGRADLAARLRPRSGAGPGAGHHGRRHRLDRDLVPRPRRPHHTSDLDVAPWAPRRTRSPTSRRPSTRDRARLGLELELVRAEAK